MTRPVALPLLVAAAAALAAASAPAQVPGRPAPGKPAPIKGLRAKHPRLLATDDDLAAVKKTMADDPVVKKWHDGLQASAKSWLAEPLPEYITLKDRLYPQTNRARRVIVGLAGLHRLDGDKAKADRAAAALLAACDFPDWNPAYMGETAEMTFAVAVGYDWLYDHLDPTDRDRVREALVEKGLRPGLRAYLASNGQGEWWTRTTNNSSAITIPAGFMIAALAVADVHPELARQVLAACSTTMARPMAMFAPDGGWAPGPGNWYGATEWLTYFLAASQTALGTDYGLKKTRGLAATAEFWRATLGPTYRPFNYGDAGDGRVGGSPQLLWLGRELKAPEAVAFERAASADRPTIFHLLWSRPTDAAAAAKEPPLDAGYRAAGVATFRGSWTDPRATFVAFKGGSNQTSGAHLDLGTFVLDALGERWVCELGGDDSLTLTGYWGPERYTYYRTGTAGQNTLVVNDQNQDPKAVALLVGYQGGDKGDKKAFAIADLGAAYGGPPGAVVRGLALLDRKHVLVQDEIAGGTAKVSAVWQVHTRAKVETAGQTATLKSGKETLHVKIVEPADAVFEAVPTGVAPPQNVNDGVTKLLIRWPRGFAKGRLAVLFSPDADATAAIEPVSKWGVAAKKKK